MPIIIFFLTATGLIMGFGLFFAYLWHECKFYILILLFFILTCSGNLQYLLNND